MACTPETQLSFIYGFSSAKKAIMDEFVKSGIKVPEGLPIEGFETYLGVFLGSVVI